MRRAVGTISLVLWLLSWAPAAMAHATFPGQSQVRADSDQRLTLDVPEERGDSVHNVGMKVFLPAEWRAVSCQATAPWRCSPSTDASGRTVIGWTKDAGSAPGADDETFVFTTHTGGPGTATVPVHQIYDSGETVRWIGSSDSEDPAPTLQVVPGQPATTTATTLPATTATTVQTTTTTRRTTTTLAPTTTATTVTTPSTTSAPTTSTPDATASPPDTVATGEAGKPASSSSATGWVLALLAVALAAGAAVVVARRRARSARR